MIRLPFAVLCAAVALTACQEPAGVGLGLIDQEGVDPNVRTVAATAVDTVGLAEPAIGFADANASAPQTRVLVGDVADAAFGDVRAVAYLDAVQPAIDGDLEAGDVSAVWLELRRTYVYGDTTATLDIGLRQIEGTWQVDDGYPADTLFDVGAELTTTEASAADSLVRWDLPTSWVTANAASLLADDFDTAFEGFSLSTAPEDSRPAVLGFSTVGSRGSGLRVVAADDTLFYPLAEVFTSIARTPAVATPAGVVPVRASTRSAAEVTIPLGDLRSLPVARAALTLPISRALLEEGPFVRPVATRSAVFGVRGSGDDETRTLLGEVQVIGDAEDARVVASAALTESVQAALLDPAQAFDRFVVTPSDSPLAPILPVSLDVLPLMTPSTERPTPRLTITVIGQPS